MHSKPQYRNQQDKIDAITIKLYMQFKEKFNENIKNIDGDITTT